MGGVIKLNITIMEQFNLEKYLTNPSRKVVTGDGRKVKILCTNRKSTYPIVALVENHDSDNESVYSYRENGLYSMFSQSEENNLFFAPEKHEGWINIRRSDNNGYYIGQNKLYNSKEEADEVAKLNDSTFIKTLKIEWED